MTNNLNSICKACGICNGSNCIALQKDLGHNYKIPNNLKQDYNGARFTADAMDCALPIALDSHSGCSFSCLYCFANNLMRAPDRNKSKIQKLIKDGSFYAEWPIRKLEAFLDRSLNDSTSKAMYPLLNNGAPVQLGALGDPFDDIEASTGWAKKAIPLFIKYKVPVRIGTKGGTNLQKKEYLKLFEQSPDQFWFAFSIITNSDRLISQIDINAPVTTERLKAMKALTNLGCSASIRFRPFLPGVSDAYPGEPMAWAKLMERACKSGARAVSFEFIFLGSAPTKRQKAMEQLMFRKMGNPQFGAQWHSISNSCEACRRGSRKFKYDMTMKIRNKAHELGMTFGCSDPHFKEYNDTGCCCGMPEQDKWFGNWSRRQLTNVIVEMRRAYNKGKIIKINYNDWRPEWAHKIKLGTMVALNNWHTHRVKKYKTFGDKMREVWNNPKAPRSPYIYFGKVMHPISIDKLTNDVVYIYKKWDKEFDKKFKGTKIVRSHNENK
jgi:DNA repair photolyase